MAYHPDNDDISNGPAVLERGESNKYIENGKLIKETNIDGVIYTNKSTSDGDKNIDTALDEFEFTDDSIGGANFTISTGDNQVFVEDNSSNIRAVFGQINSGDYGLQTLTSGGTELFGIYGSTANIAGWSVNSSSLVRTYNNKTISLIAGDEPRLAVDFGAANLLKAGYIDSSSVGLLIKNSIGSEVIRIDDTGTTKIAGWHFTASTLQSDVNSQARIELNSGDMRVSVVKADNSTLTAMGYLGGLVKNNSIGHQIASVQGGGSTAIMVLTGITSDEHEDAFNPGTLVGLQYFIASSNGAISGSSPGLVSANTYNTITVTATGANAAISAAHSAGLEYFVLKFATDDYGFWAAQGDKMRIDGNVEYDSGDWLIHSDGALKFSTGDGSEVMRLGTHTGKRGLFIGSDLASGTAPLAQYTGSKILIGNEAGEHLKYTTAGGLVVSGTVTVSNPGDTSTTAREDFKAATLDTGVWTIVGNTTQVSTPTGIGFMDNVETSTWDSGIRWSDAFKREHAPSFYWDFEILGVGVENNYEFIGWWLNKTDMSYLRMLYGIYVSNDDIMWRYGADASGSQGDFGAYNTEFIGAANSLVVGVNWRLVIQIRTGGGAFGYIYKNGDYTTPFSTYTWTTGTQTEMYLGSDYAHGETDGDIPKVEHQNLTAGNLQPAISTQISGGLVKTGKIESTDGNTFFDLNNNTIQMDDDANLTRLTLGNYTGNNYALRIARPGIDLTSATTSDDMIFSSDWGIPKTNVLFGGAKEKTDGSGLLDTEYSSGYSTESGNVTVNSSTDGTSMYNGNRNWKVNEWVGSTIIRTNAGWNSSTQLSDSSMRAYAQITSNTSNTITSLPLEGGYPSSGVANGNDWAPGDAYKISEKPWGQFSKSDAYYVGTQKMTTTYSDSAWITASQGTTIAVFPYLHDKVNKFIRLGAFLSAETSLRLGIYRYTWNPHDTAQKLQLELAGVRDKGRFFYDTDFINNLVKGDAVWTDNTTGTSWAQPAWYVCTNSTLDTGDFSNTPYLDIGLSNGSLASHFVEIYERFPFMKITNTNNVNGSYAIATMDLESHLQSTYKLGHGELYIIRLTGGRTSNTEYNTDDSHLVMQPQVTVHGYDFNAINNNDST